MKFEEYKGGGPLKHMSREAFRTVKLQSVIDRLPKEVQKFIDKNIEFEWIQNVCGITLPTKYYKPIIIIYTEHIPEWSIAHEIAHAWLGHDPNVFGFDQEDEADEQAKSWGFIKFYATTTSILDYLELTGV